MHVCHLLLQCYQEYTHTTIVIMVNESQIIGSRQGPFHMTRKNILVKVDSFCKQCKQHGKNKDNFEI